MDRVWRFTTMNRSPTGYLIRYATLPHLAGLRRKVSTLAQFQAAQDHLRRRWHIRLRELREAKSVTVSEERFPYIANCPPAGGRAHDQNGKSAVTCRLSRVCPWCWARLSVVPAFRSLTGAVTLLPGDPSQKEAAGAARSETILTRSGSPDFAFRLAVVRLEMYTAALKVVGCRAAVLGASVEPGEQPGEFLVRSWAVAATSGSDADRGFVARTLDVAGRVKVAAAVDPMAVAKLFLGVVRFPRGMWDGDAAAAAKVLDARPGVRLLRTVGLAHSRGAATLTEAEE